MLHIVLYRPEIPPNTGNIIRLCANTGTQLHLVHPLGFTLDDKRLRRAGLDYHEWASVHHYDDWTAFEKAHPTKRVWVCSTKSTKRHTDVQYASHDMLLFGQETRGLPDLLRAQYPGVRIPMLSNSRSINLSNAVAIVLYEAWRQLSFTFPETADAP